MRHPSVTHLPRPMSGHCPCTTLNCHLTTGFPPSCPFHVSHDVLVLSLPCRSTPFMSLTFSRRYVRFICHVCPAFSLRVISLHLPSCRLVSLCFVSLSFPLHCPCFHFCPLHVPFSSPLFRRCNAERERERQRESRRDSERAGERGRETERERERERDRERQREGD